MMTFRETEELLARALRRAVDERRAGTSPPAHHKVTNHGPAVVVVVSPVGHMRALEAGDYAIGELSSVRIVGPGAAHFEVKEHK